MIRNLRALAALIGCGLLAGCTWLDPTLGIRQTPKESIDRSTTTRSIFSMPRFGFGSGRASGLPAQEARCRKDLKRLGVTFEDIPAVGNGGACGIAHPVKVSGLARGVKLVPEATLNCAMAREAARWVQGEMAMATRTRYLTGIAEVRQMSSYSCRRIRGSGQWSEHSKGNALDIGAIKLKNGKMVKVVQPGLFSFRHKSYLRKIRSGACDYFTTVLGPGSDADHADHFHFDLRARKSGYRHCD